MLDWALLIETCAPGVAPQTMRALVQVESGFRPHAIGYKVVGSDGKVYTLERSPGNSEEAIAWASWLLKNNYRFDAGAAQINSVNFARFNLGPANVFEVCTNLYVSSRILSECFVRARDARDDPQAALHAALSCYNSGNFRTGFANGYVAKVTAASATGADHGGPPAPTPTLVPPLRADVHKTTLKGTLKATPGKDGLLGAPSEVAAFRSDSKDAAQVWADPAADVAASFPGTTPVAPVTDSPPDSRVESATDTDRPAPQ